MSSLLNHGFMCTLLLASLLFGRTRSELFNSLSRMKNIPAIEKSLPDLLTDYIKAERQRLDELSFMIENLKQQVIDKPEIEDMERLMSQPISVYRFLRETYSWSSEVMSLLSTREDAQLTKALDGLPDESDMHGVGKALVRLQMVYLDQADFTNRSGLVLTHQDVLTTEEMFDLINHSLNDSDFFSALEFSYRVLEMYEEEDDVDGQWKANDFIAYSLHRQGNIELAIKTSKETAEYYRHRNQTEESERLEDNIRQYYDELAEKGIIYDEDNLPEVISEKNPDLFYPDYEALCNGEKLDGLTNADPKSCYLYTNNNHPLLVLAPAHVEEIEPSINLIFVHDVLTDSEIQLLKDIAVNEFELSGVAAEVEEQSVDTTTRSSLTAWVADDRDVMVKHISGRVGAVTGLSLVSAEMFQVLSYGVGGFYLPHFDWDDREDAFGEAGNRIATWIFYLNNVRKGGATAFPNIGAAVWPEKGGAAFWTNLYKNGTGNELNLHAACPVLEGYKWVSNKWFHEVANEFTRPCDLSSDV